MGFCWDVNEKPQLAYLKADLIGMVGRKTGWNSVLCKGNYLVATCLATCLRHDTTSLNPEKAAGKAYHHQQSRTVQLEMDKWID